MKFTHLVATIEKIGYFASLKMRIMELPMQYGSCHWIIVLAIGL